MRRGWSWRSRAARGAAYQLLAVALVALTAWFLVSNTLENMRVRGIQSGFDFLSQPAGFAIGESPIDYDSAEPYWKAFAVGLLNTLRVAVTGIVLITILGTLIGIGRLSRNFLLRGLCAAYVETFRNLPVLIQMFMWYFVITDWLPELAQAIELAPGVFLSKSGLALPLPGDIPARGEAAVVGGAALTPEFLAVTIGLTVYTAAFVAEAVRAGIQSVPAGQTEAAAALGLSRVQSLRFVLLPQAVRVIIPSLTNQYLNLTKNSSLAVAIGYPDLVSIANTSLNQTGRAVECIVVIMAVYLALSLATALATGWYARHMAIRER